MKKPTEKDIKDIFIDIDEIYKEEEEKYKKALKDEEDRVENIECPCCNSKEKFKHHHTENNGVYGPGFYSKTISDYYICNVCGVHYTDLNKKEIQPPSRSPYNNIFR